MNLPDICFYIVKIFFDRRLENDNGSICKMSVDGTDFLIYEPRPFSGMWKSHKFEQSGLRYEIGLCIQTGLIAWIHGPFPAGRWNDIKIFRYKLKHTLPPGERVECDNEYKGEFAKIDLPLECLGKDGMQKRIKDLVRARHKNLNRRYKQFGCLKQCFRHPIQKHVVVFSAISAVVQISLENGHPLFDLAHEYKTIDDKFI